jgi:hypothetical protein
MNTLSLEQISDIITCKSGTFCQKLVESNVIPEFVEHFKYEMKSTNSTWYDLTESFFLINSMGFAKFLKENFDDEFILGRFTYYVNCFAGFNSIGFHMDSRAIPSFSIEMPDKDKAKSFKACLDLYDCLKTSLNNQIVPFDDAKGDFVNIDIDIDLLYKMTASEISKMTDVILDREPKDLFTIEGYRTEKDCDNQTNLEHFDAVSDIEDAYTIHENNQNDFYLLTIVDNDGKLHS